MHLERALALAGALALGWFLIAWLDARVYQAQGRAELERTLAKAEAAAPAGGVAARAAEAATPTPAETGEEGEGAEELREPSAPGLESVAGGEPPATPGRDRAGPGVAEAGSEARRGPRPSPAAADPPRAPTRARTAAAPAERSLAGEALGLLEIPRLGVSVVVAEGIGSRTLRRAVGHLPETPLPGAPGNTAIAGHRDSHFLPLRHILVGDEVRVRTAQGLFRYEVEWARVVEPTAVEVLEPTDHAALTLITCYPFSHLGAAPDRYVVRARLKG